MAEYPADATTGVKIRAEVAALLRRNTGQGIAALENIARSETGNPYPPLPGVVKSMVAAAERMNRLPDPQSAALIEELSSFLGVPGDRVAVGTGSVGVLQQLMQATSGPGHEVVYAWRSFEAYPIITQIAGASPVEIPLRADETHDLEAMADAITDRTRLVLVCNPNNPTGAIIGRAELDRFLDRVPENVLVVLDEAYVEFVRDAQYPDGIAISRERGNVCVLRTFSKAHGLAGLRIGYAVGPEPVAAALRACAVPYGVNLLAQAAAIESIRAQHELMDRVDQVVAERDRVFAELSALDLPTRQGIEVRPSQGDFYWLRLGERSAAFADACTAAGTTVRLYPSEGVRVTIGEREANDRVLEVLGAGFSGGRGLPDGKH